ncbi:hypothetical protein A2U01_0114634, partial [Trifolium medium]|nr:hypothetical protein [Trifolium medium]
MARGGFNTANDNASTVVYADPSRNPRDVYYVHA